MSLPISALIVTSSKYIIRINKPTREDSGAITTATAVHGWSRAHKSVFNFITSPLKICPQSLMSNIKMLIPYNTGLCLTAIQLKTWASLSLKNLQTEFLHKLAHTEGAVLVCDALVLLLRVVFTSLVRITLVWRTFMCWSSANGCRNKTCANNS
jgi:hypothetical protein